MFGASFSVPYAQYLGLDPKRCLEAALQELGIRRLRLMSYWNRLEPVRGNYDFRELDWQIDMAERRGAEVTLCLGLRQPRWPESHWPSWALQSPDTVWQPALMDFIGAVVERYKDRACIVSYQLENEALNRSFGKYGNFDRKRLQREFALIKQLDPSRPVLMSTSNSWGLPLRRPLPDGFGFSIYRYFYHNGGYRHSKLRPGWYRMRARLIKLLTGRPSFIHELQAEPWGPTPIPGTPLDEQFQSMSLRRIKKSVNFARKTRLQPVDLWGLEWWYWLKTEAVQPEIWQYLQSVYQD